MNTSASAYPLARRALAAERPLLVWASLLATAWLVRLGIGLSSGASLHVDEAQYWDWSRHLQWGYFSKPPLIAALIQASTTLFGSHESGLRALTLACYPLSAALLACLAWRMQADPLQAKHSARWAAALLLASPLAGLLGLVATTDAPLLLAWSAGLLLLWEATERRRRAAWLGFGLALGLGLLAKYSMAALGAGALLWVLLARRERSAGLGLLLAFAVAALCLAPNLAWNASQGWPTLRHTAEITFAATQTATKAGGFLSVLSFAAGQCFVAAPLLLLPALAWPFVPHRLVSVAPAPMRFALLTALPLLLAGLLQAWRSGAELNWIAPAHLSLLLLLALLLAQAPLPLRRVAFGLLAAQALLVALLSWLPRWEAVRAHWPLDPWVRMRGWSDALELAGRQLPAGAKVLIPSRSLMAQAAYHWRDRPLARASWQPQAEAAHHYQLRCAWRDGQASDGLWVLHEGQAAPAGLGKALAGQLRTQAQWRVPLQPGRDLVLTLQRVEAPAALPDKGATSWCQ